MSKPMIYVAHPYGGKENNKLAAEEIMKDLVVNDSKHVYFSPIHNFGMVYFEKEYEKGLEICLNALERCNGLILCGDWRQSKGCMGEWAYAKAKNIKIYTLTDWKNKINQKEDKGANS